ncbi:MAG: Inner membrane protein YaaH [Syntrophorhabdus sp. PtaU1.Bin153]|nr:MAG: Inner membrane protein YaaH [Syntrophorhabdus sp. PtaU1.Bin153]
MSDLKLANPGAVGLGAFGLTTMVLQFHNLGWCGMGPVLASALIFGGLAQLVAGFQEMKTGNSFGYAAFSGYGSFWISLAVILLANHFNIFKSTGIDIGWFLVAWTLYTAILWIGSMRINSALALTFTALLIGFLLLDLAHFGYPILTVVAGYELIVTAILAWYVMAHIIFLDLSGKDLLPAGKPWIK